MAGAVELSGAALFGALLFGGGAVWVVWALVLHRAAGNPLGPAAAPAVLLDEGPFRFGRNPMYLGLLAMLIGAALGLRLPPLALLALALAVLMQRVLIPREEANLAQRFGGWWRDYAADVRRWI